MLRALMSGSAWVARAGRRVDSCSLESGLLEARSEGQDGQLGKCRVSWTWPAGYTRFMVSTSLLMALLLWLAAPSSGCLPCNGPALARTGHIVPAGTHASLVQTARDTGDLMASLADVPFMVDFAFDGPVVDVDLAATDQKIVGFGGAFTEASALVFKGLRKDLQQEVLDKYFGPDGIGYSTGRVPINSCDFSPASYSFDDVEGDFELKHFDTGVRHDTEVMIPFIQAAQRLLAKHGKALRLLASPWSPPAWMKTNGQMVHSGSPGLRAECRASWAKYISKWISAYKAHGLPIWALTAQNEPMASQEWESCVYSAQQGAEFIGHFLGPTIREDHPEVAMFAYDHNKEDSYDWAHSTYSHEAASTFVQGLAVHWYDGDGFETVRRVHRDFPHAVILPTEATYERHRWAPGSSLATGDWKFGEGYAHDIIGDLNAGASGWTDWNLILDERGGPNHVDNVCDAAMVASLSGEELHVHPQYYFIGHFSKYLLPGSVRVETSVCGTASYRGSRRPYGTCSDEDGLQATSFLRPDGRVATVVLNCGGAEVRFKLRDLRGGRALAARIPAHAVQTYMFERGT